MKSKLGFLRECGRLEAIFSNPIICKEILLKLELDSLAKAELVCKDWRRNVMDNRVWKHKLVKGRAGHCHRQREELVKLCRAMCWELQHGADKWLDEKSCVDLTPEGLQHQQRR